MGQVPACKWLPGARCRATLGHKYSNCRIVKYGKTSSISACQDIQAAFASASITSCSHAWQTQHNIESLPGKCMRIGKVPAMTLSQGHDASDEMQLLQMRCSCFSDRKTCAIHLCACRLQSIHASTLPYSAINKA